MTFQWNNMHGLGTHYHADYCEFFWYWNKSSVFSKALQVWKKWFLTQWEVLILERGLNHTFQGETFSLGEVILPVLPMCLGRFRSIDPQLRL